MILPPKDQPSGRLLRGLFSCHVLYVLLHPGLFDPRKDELDREDQDVRIAKLRAETKTEDNCFSGITMDAILVQPKKAELPIDVTLVGISIVVKLWQLANVDPSMDVILA